ncbi:aromatic amino acid ammonia-lyase, partial [Escherichia coli]|nr:aromatic amino acid ammonia-lyase [Escherichia coli]
MTNNNNHNITFGAQSLTIEDVVAIAQGAKANMNPSPEFTAKIDRGVAFLERLLKEEGVIYGVTTGYGDSCTVAIPPALV